MYRVRYASHIHIISMPSNQMLLWSYQAQRCAVSYEEKGVVNLLCSTL